MHFTDRQIAHILACLRICQGQDIRYMDHFEELPPLSDEQVHDLCLEISTGESLPGRYTVVSLFPDSEWDGNMREASSVEFVEADTLVEAARIGRKQAATRRIVLTDGDDERAITKERRDLAENSITLSVFEGHRHDVYDPAKEESESL